MSFRIASLALAAITTTWATLPEDADAGCHRKRGRHHHRQQASACCGTSYTVAPTYQTAYAQPVYTQPVQATGACCGGSMAAPAYQTQSYGATGYTNQGQTGQFYGNEGSMQQGYQQGYQQQGFNTQSQGGAIVQGGNQGANVSGGADANVNADGIGVGKADMSADGGR